MKNDEQVNDESKNAFNQKFNPKNELNEIFEYLNDMFKPLPTPSFKAPDEPEKEVSFIWLANRINTYAPLWKAQNESNILNVGNHIAIKLGKITNESTMTHSIMACYSNVTLTKQSILVQSLEDSTNLEIITLK